MVMIKFFGTKKKFIYALIILLISIIIACGIYAAKIKPISDGDIVLQSALSTFSTEGKLEEGTTVSQDYVAKENLKGVGMLFNYGGASENGAVHVKIENADNDDLIYEKDIPASEIQDNVLYQIHFDQSYNIDDSAVIKVSFTSSGFEKGSEPAFYVFENDVYAGSMALNGKQLDFDMSLEVYGDNFGSFGEIYWRFAIFAIVMLQIIYILAFVKRSEKHVLFTVMAALLSVIMLFVMTPNSVPDEVDHFETAYRYSNAMCGLPYATEDGSMLMRECDDAQLGIDNFYITPGITQYRSVAEGFFGSAENTEMIARHGGSASKYPVLYAPQALGISLAKAVNATPVGLYYMGRIFNLIVYGALMFFAIKKIPFGKIPLLIIGILPMTLHLACSYSYDAIVMGLASLFVSYCFYIAYGKQKPTLKDYIILAASFLLLAPGKAIYLPLGLLLLLIPTNRFGSLKKRIICLAGIAVAAILMWYGFNSAAVTSIAGSSVGSSGWSGEQPYTLSYALANMGQMAKVLYNDLVTHFEYYFFTMFGSSLGWLNINVPFYIMIFFPVLLAVSALKTQKEDVIISRKAKLLMFIIALVCCLLAVAAMLFAWTPMGSAVVLGVQGRYFLPVLFLFIMLFRNTNVCMKHDIRTRIAYISMSICLFALAIIFVGLI